MTRKDNVYLALKRALRDRANNDGWVRASFLTHPSIGGSEGLRRLRELRADGVEIEMRKRPGRAPNGKPYTEREYRLVVPQRVVT